MAARFCLATTMTTTHTTTRSPWRILGPVFGALAVMGLVAMILFARFCGQVMDNGGVKTGNALTAKQRQGLAGVVAPGEKVLAYYDSSLTGDQQELAILTSQRVVYIKEGHTSQMPVANIVRCQIRDEGIVGDVIEVEGTDGELITIEVAPVNGGPTFFAAIEAARRGARVPSPAPSGT